MRYLLVILLLCLNLPATALELARDGKARAVIVSHRWDPAPVRFAAEELKRYLDRITGADFEIVGKEPDEGPAVVLGQARAWLAGIRVDDLTRDGYLLKTIGDKVYVFGTDSSDPKAEILFTVYDGPLPEKADSHDRSAAYGEVVWDFERGTLHGAYALLEELGVRWFFPGPQGEVVPSQTTLELPPLNIREEPHFLFRWDGGIVVPNRTIARRKSMDVEEYAELGWTGRGQRLWLMRVRASSKWIAFNHRPQRTDFAKRFAADHPEYFALMPDGRRADGTHPDVKRPYLNYTSEGMLRETIADARAYFSGKPATSRGMDRDPKFDYNRGWTHTVASGGFFSLLPSDGLRVDQSPESRRFIDEDAPLPKRHNNYIWQFVDKVGRAIGDEFPGQYLCCLAYQAYWEVPTVIDKLPDNVVVGLAALSGPSHVLRNTQPRQYEYLLDLMKRWDDMSAAPLLFWNYWHHGGSFHGREGVGLHLPHHAARWIRDSAPHGRWMYILHDKHHLMMEHINRYVIHRCLWNPETDVDALLDDYYEKYYGPAAEPMGRLFSDLETRYRESASVRADHISIWENYFDENRMNEYRGLLDRAARMAGDTVYGERVGLIDRYWYAVMKEARDRYVRETQSLVAEGADIIDPATFVDPIVIDGKLKEKTWRRAPRNGMYNNQDGRKVEATRARAFVKDGTLYVAWDSRGDYLVDGKPPPRTTVEMFIQPNPESPEFYQVWIALDGQMRSWLFPDVGEPGDPDWDSRAEHAIDIEPGSWSVELALPLERIAAGRPEDAEYWRVLFCRTIMTTEDRRNRFATVNPIHRGTFGQPALFARLPARGKEGE